MKNQLAFYLAGELRAHAVAGGKPSSRCGPGDLRQDEHKGRQCLGAGDSKVSKSGHLYARGAQAVKYLRDRFARLECK